MIDVLFYFQEKTAPVSNADHCVYRISTVVFASSYMFDVYC